MSTPLTVMVLVKEAFEELNVPYLVGGSVASSIHGMPRTTQDVDFVAAMTAEQVPPFVAALQDECYVDADMIYDAIRTKSSFNILHLATMHKADVFVQNTGRWEEEKMARRGPEPVKIGDHEEIIQVASPEDMVLQKLFWYWLGGSVSDRQWLDVTGMLKVQASKLDYHYLRQWADELQLTDLLQRAYQDSGIETHSP